jgi:hypothetical protein
MTLVDNRVASYTITYAETKDLQLAEEFLNKAGKSLGVEEYATERVEPLVFLVKCDGFNVVTELKTHEETFMGAVTSRTYTPSLGVGNVSELARVRHREEDARRRIETEKKKKEEESRQSFNP